MPTEVVIDGNSLTLDDVIAVARSGAIVSLAPVARERARSSRRIVDTLVNKQAVAYGVTTGLGAGGAVARGAVTARATRSTTSAMLP